MAPPNTTTLPPRQRAPKGAPPAPAARAEDGTQLQVRISELDPVTTLNDTDNIEVSQGSASRRANIVLLKQKLQPDLSPFLTGVMGGSGIVVLGGAPVPTIQLEDAGATGTYGDATHVPKIDVDQHGRVVSVNLVPIAPPDLSGYAPLASPAFTGNPTAPTPAPGDADTSIATTKFVTDALAAGATGAPIDSPAFTGNPTAPTPLPGDNDSSLATTAFVHDAIAALPVIDLSPYALLASPVFTGNPTAPTPAPGDSDQSIATTQFVMTALSPYALLASPVFTGNPTAPTPAPGDSDQSLATTQFVMNAIGNAASISTGLNPPASPKPNQLWWKSDTGILYVYYDDGTSQQWVPASPQASLAPPQVVQAALLDPFTLGAVAWTDITGLSVAITPRSAASRFKIEVSLGKVGPPNNQGASFRLQRNNAPIGVGNAAASRQQVSFQMVNASSTDHGVSASFNWLDSPGTASLITYNVQGFPQSAGVIINASNSDTNDATIYHGRAVSTLIVSEVP